MLLLDAALPTSIVKNYLPRLEVLADIQAVSPYLEVRNVLGSWGKTSLVPNSRNGAENKRRRRVLAKLADFVALNSQGHALIVTYEGLEHWFKDIPGVAVEHFNNVRGLDVHKDVA